MFYHEWKLQPSIEDRSVTVKLMRPSHGGGPLTDHQEFVKAIYDASSSRLGSTTGTKASPQQPIGQEIEARMLAVADMTAARYRVGADDAMAPDAPLPLIDF